MSRPYMPLYIADYLSATEHLDAAQSGAYLHLIMHYWQKGGLPSDDRFLARIAKMTTRQWSAAKPTLQSFFIDGWRHDRIDSEIAKSDLKAQARAESGKRGGDSKSLNDKERALAKATVLPDKPPSKTPSKPLPSSSGLGLESKEPIANAIGDVKPKKQNRPTRLTADSQLSAEGETYAREHGLSADRIAVEFEKMRNWSISNPKGAMLDWDRTWQNWVLRIGQERARPPPRRSMAEIARMPLPGESGYVEPTPNNSRTPRAAIAANGGAAIQLNGSFGRHDGPVLDLVAGGAERGGARDSF